MSTEPRHEIERLVLAFAASAEAGQAAEYFDQVAHPSYIFVGADGRREARATHLTGWQRLQAVRRYHEVRPWGVEVVIAGASAVATFFEQVRGEQGGHHFSRTFFWSAHFTHDQGRWWLLAEHASVPDSMRGTEEGENR